MNGGRVAFFVVGVIWDAVSNVDAKCIQGLPLLLGLLVLVLVLEGWVVAERERWTEVVHCGEVGAKSWRLYEGLLTKDSAGGGRELRC